MQEKLQLLKEKMLEGVNTGVFPGTTYAVILDQDIYVDCVGYKSLYPTREINDLTTLYDIASLSKVLVTNVLISQMLEEKIIYLDDKVIKFFPSFMHDDITILDLLTHSSGLPANIDWINIKSREYYIDAIFHTEKIYINGSKAVYSDIGFIILGLIIERVLNESLDIIAKKRIFSQLDMNNTLYNPKDITSCAPTSKEGNVYLRGVAHGKKTQLFNGVVGHAGVFSTITDMTKFVQMILNNGNYKNNQIVSPDIIELWFKPQIKDIDGFYHGLGWISGENKLIGKYTSDHTIYHAGFTGTRILVDQQNKLGFVLLSNCIHSTGNNKKLRKFRKEIIDYVYELFIIDKVRKTNK